MPAHCQEDWYTAEGRIDVTAENENDFPIGLNYIPTKCLARIDSDMLFFVIRRESRQRAG